jgi:hypothetical protein
MTAGSSIRSCDEKPLPAHVDNRCIEPPQQTHTARGNPVVQMTRAFFHQQSKGQVPDGNRQLLLEKNKWILSVD